MRGLAGIVAAEADVEGMFLGNDNALKMYLIFERRKERSWCYIDRLELIRNPLAIVKGCL